MIFTQTPLAGAFLVEIEMHRDERGFFARSWCAREFAAAGLNPQLAQCNISFNAKKGTLRGMHYQVPPFAEAKLVRCTMGSLYDVIVDLRPGSPSFGEQFGVVLSARERNMLYVPEGFAHGFLTLEDDTEAFYQMSRFFEPDAARGFAWNDPAFAISWPAEVRVISGRDAAYPPFGAAGELP